MTKYVLNSGGVTSSPDKAKKFFSEVVRDLGEKPKILLCFFAIPREDWEEKFAKDVQELPQYFSQNIKPEFTLAFPDNFVEQIKNTDAIYIHGGDDQLVMYWLKKFDIPKIWEDKVIATNSASSHALSTYFWTCDWRQCMDGLGILSIKFLAHFHSDYGSLDPRGQINWEDAKEALENYKDKTLSLYALEEGDFIVKKYQYSS